jgi:hypothetical protein
MAEIDLDELLKTPETGEWECVDLILEASGRLTAMLEMVSFAQGETPLRSALEIVRDTLRRAIDAYEWDAPAKAS